jgi:DNA-binding helix-hairpin-helix protein with protein kinase domain
VSLSEPKYLLRWPDGRQERIQLTSTGKSGGAGEIHDVEGFPHYVVKLYHDTTKPDSLKKYSHKISWMMHNVPDLPHLTNENQNRIVQLAWPLAMVFRNGQFCGFLMHKINFSQTLELDYLLTRKQAEREGFMIDFGVLMIVAYNLAALLGSLHRKKIAVVDLKPMNLKVHRSGLYMSILDCDGFSILADGFSADAPQVTAEYLAPEFQGTSVKEPEAQDRFALAAIIFRLLNYGIHPFVGITTQNVRFPTELSGRIKMGLYPYGRQPHAQIKPAPASVHETFPDALRQLFDRAFAWPVGTRPSPNEWTGTLEPFVIRQRGLMHLCEHGHLQYASMPCSTCFRSRKLNFHMERLKKRGPHKHRAPMRAFNVIARPLHTANPFLQAQLGSGPSTPTPVIALNMKQALLDEFMWLLAMAVIIWWIA